MNRHERRNEGLDNITQPSNLMIATLECKCNCRCDKLFPFVCLSEQVDPRGISQSIQSKVSKESYTHPVSKRWLRKMENGVHADDMTYACGAQQAHIWYTGKLARWRNGSNSSKARFGAKPNPIQHSNWDDQGMSILILTHDFHGN